MKQKYDYKDIETKKDVPFWKSRELWISSFIFFLIIGYILFVIMYGLTWLMKWIIFSPIRPFTNSEWLCDQGFHKYRIKKDKYPEKKIYKCIICNKEKIIKYYYDYCY